jgi:amino acid transporter
MPSTTNSVSGKDSKGRVNASYAKETDTSEFSAKEERAEIEASKELKIGPFSIWALGITIVIGGQMFSWNESLISGFGSTFISVFLIGTAYICLCLCNAEMTSALPFAGGAYGLARVTLGLYPGFLIVRNLCLYICTYVYLCIYLYLYIYIHICQLISTHM